MAPLEELELYHPLIDSHFRSFCASHGIFTVHDFLVHDLYELEAFAERDCAHGKLKRGITQMLSEIESMHRPWSNGLELLEDAQLNKGTLSTGYRRIDDLLQGGLHEGHVTELVGPSSSGKTQVCLKSASHVASKYSGTVMFFDTGNSFSANRIAHFLSQSPGPTDTGVNKTVQQSGCQIKLLIIDSLSSLIAPVLGGGAHGHALMLTAGFLLKELAHEHNLSVLVTNHMVAGEVGILKPALGESWKSVPHVRLLISKCYATKSSSISILKHPYLATGNTTEFLAV